MIGATYFRPLGKCSRSCGREATGTLMNGLNASLGNMCARCAQGEIAAEQKRVARLNRLTGTTARAPVEPRAASEV